MSNGQEDGEGDAKEGGGERRMEKSVRERERKREGDGGGRGEWIRWMGWGAGSTREPTPLVKKIT